MELSWNELLSTKEGKFYLVTSRERDLDIFLGRSYKEDSKVIARIIRGVRCTKSESLNQEFGAALQFPYWSVGDNWDGFNDMFGSMPENSDIRYFLFVTNFDKVLADKSQDLHIFLDILKATVAKWNRPDESRVPVKTVVPINIVFHCKPEHGEKCKAILAKEQIQSILRVLQPFDNVL